MAGGAFEPDLLTADVAVEDQVLNRPVRLAMVVVGLAHDAELHADRRRYTPGKHRSTPARSVHMVAALA